MKQIFIVVIMLAVLNSCATNKSGKTNSETDRALIKSVLLAQQRDWNKGDLTAYMQGYWQSDSLAFVGKNGISYGWQQTLINYRKAYPNPTAMGQLSFTILKLEITGPEHAYMLGKWHLARTVGDLQGHFSLLWRKQNGNWVIVSDHSS